MVVGGEGCVLSVALAWMIELDRPVSSDQFQIHPGGGDRLQLFGRTSRVQNDVADVGAVDEVVPGSAERVGLFLRQRPRFAQLDQRAKTGSPSTAANRLRETLET